MPAYPPYFDYEEPDDPMVALAEAIIEVAMAEATRARTLHPAWPPDLIHAVAVVNEEAGEMVKAANEWYWQHKGTTIDDVYTETIHTMAMCLRLLTETPALTRILLRDADMMGDEPGEGNEL